MTFAWIWLIVMFISALVGRFSPGAWLSDQSFYIIGIIIGCAECILDHAEGVMKKILKEAKAKEE